VDSDAIKGIAQTYFDAWRSRDFDRLRSILADDVSFRGPLGTTDGADATIAGLRGMTENVMRDIDISLMAVDGSDVLTWYDLHTSTTEPLPTVNWSHVENGLISRIRAVFDPRPLFPSDAGS
jgi:limonene-1,2-epoxide hydrolase